MQTQSVHAATSSQEIGVGHLIQINETLRRENGKKDERIRELAAHLDTLTQSVERLQKENEEDTLTNVAVMNNPTAPPRPWTTGGGAATASASSAPFFALRQVQSPAAGKNAVANRLRSSATSPPQVSGILESDLFYYPGGFGGLAPVPPVATAAAPAVSGSSSPVRSAWSASFRGPGPQLPIGGGGASSFGPPLSIGFNASPVTRMQPAKLNVNPVQPMNLKNPQLLPQKKFATFQPPMGVGIQAVPSHAGAESAAKIRKSSSRSPSSSEEKRKKKPRSIRKLEESLVQQREQLLSAFPPHGVNPASEHPTHHFQPAAVTQALDCNAQAMVLVLHHETVSNVHRHLERLFQQQGDVLLQLCEEKAVAGRTPGESAGVLHALGSNTRILEILRRAGERQTGKWNAADHGHDVDVAKSSSPSSRHSSRARGPGSTSPSPVMSSTARGEGSRRSRRRRSSQDCTDLELLLAVVDEFRNQIKGLGLAPKIEAELRSLETQINLSLAAAEHTATRADKVAAEGGSDRGRGCAGSTATATTRNSQATISELIRRVETCKAAAELEMRDRGRRAQLEEQALEKLSSVREKATQKGSALLLSAKLAPTQLAYLHAQLKSRLREDVQRKGKQLKKAVERCLALKKNCGRGIGPPPDEKVKKQVRSLQEALGEARKDLETITADGKRLSELDAKTLLQSLHTARITRIFSRAALDIRAKLAPGMASSASSFGGSSGATDVESSTAMVVATAENAMKAVLRDFVEELENAGATAAAFSGPTTPAWMLHDIPAGVGASSRSGSPSPSGRGGAPDREKDMFSDAATEWSDLPVLKTRVFSEVGPGGGAGPSVAASGSSRGVAKKTKTPSTASGAKMSRTASPSGNINVLHQKSGVYVGSLEQADRPRGEQTTTSPPVLASAAFRSAAAGSAELFLEPSSPASAATPEDLLQPPDRTDGVDVHVGPQHDGSSAVLPAVPAAAPRPRALAPEGDAAAPPELQAAAQPPEHITSHSLHHQLELHEDHRPEEPFSSRPARTLELRQLGLGDDHDSAGGPPEGARPPYMMLPDSWNSLASSGYSPSTGPPPAARPAIAEAEVGKDPEELDPDSIESQLQRIRIPRFPPLPPVEPDLAKPNTNTTQNGNGNRPTLEEALHRVEETSSSILENTLRAVTMAPPSATSVGGASSTGGRPASSAFSLLFRGGGAGGAARLPGSQESLTSATTDDVSGVHGDMPLVAQVAALRREIERRRSESHQRTGGGGRDEQLERLCLQLEVMERHVDVEAGGR